jgi:hypothetical protein
VLLVSPHSGIKRDSCNPFLPAETTPRELRFAVSSPSNVFFKRHRRINKARVLNAICRTHFHKGSIVECNTVKVVPGCLSRFVVLEEHRFDSASLLNPKLQPCTTLSPNACSLGLENNLFTSEPTRQKTVPNLPFLSMPHNQIASYNLPNIKRTLRSPPRKRSEFQPPRSSPPQAPSRLTSLNFSSKATQFVW